MQELEDLLKEDLARIGLDVTCNISIRGYSKSYFGRYDPNTNTIILYVLESPEGDMYPYLNVLLTTVHEAVHCKQWSDPKFKRIRGVMHDVEFKTLYNVYADRAKSLVLLKEMKSCAVYS